MLLVPLLIGAVVTSGAVAAYLIAHRKKKLTISPSKVQIVVGNTQQFTADT
jgi:hypothetical protein